MNIKNLEDLQLHKRLGETFEGISIERTSLDNYYILEKYRADILVIPYHIDFWYKIGWIPATIHFK